MLNELCDVSWSDEQKRDIDIARVIELKRVGQKLTKRQISKEWQYVRKLLIKPGQTVCHSVRLTTHVRQTEIIAC
jgi:hypothetical protein